MVFALSVAALCSSVLIQTPDSATRASQPTASVGGGEEVRDLMLEWLETRGLPGLSLAVVVRDELVVSECLGWADVEREIPLVRESLFRIGSVSKLLTATACLRLRQAGKLDLDAPIGSYLPDLPDDKAVVSARQLAGHLAGFAHYGSNDYVNTRHFEDVSDTLPPLLSRALLSAPGAKYAYSSYGYNVLGAVLQSAASQEFRDVIAEQVLAPLGMTHTLAEDSAHAPPERVRLYVTGDDGKRREAGPSDVTDRWPSGGFLSTAEDLARLGTGLARPGFLDGESARSVLTPQRDSTGAETRVGFGWRIAKDAAGRRYLHHGGESIGGRAFVLVYPDERVTVGIATNLSFADVGEKEALAVAALFLGEAPEGPREERR
jgi:CubicO group peptidase (beta-lactamase class C family)